MKNILLTIFDFIFPRRDDDVAIFDISPHDFYKKIPKWQEEIYPNISAIFHYKDPTAKSMIKELKSSKNKHAARISALAMINFFEKSGINDAIIIPMPISRKRRRKRGYNQCELIAKFFMKEIEARKNNRPKTDLNNKFIANKNFEVRTDILERPIDTVKFALEKRDIRISAAKGIFKTTCTLSHIERHIIIVDDVITTGSTMSSAIDTLQFAGATNLCGLGIAH